MRKYIGCHQIDMVSQSKPQNDSLISFVAKQDRGEDGTLGNTKDKARSNSISSTLGWKAQLNSIPKESINKGIRGIHKQLFLEA